MIKVGCCGFPCSREKYFKDFKIIEIQKTFYQPPNISIIKKWQKEAPEDFEFTVKAWQIITHPASSPTYRKFKEKFSEDEKKYFGFFNNNKYVFSAWERIKEIAKELKSKIILFQSPASFKSQDKNINNLIKFFRKIKDKRFKFVWEPRGNWDNNFLKKLSSKIGIYICFDPFKEKPFSQKLIYLRLHGRRGYNYKYNKKELKNLVKIIKNLKFKDCYVLFNNIYMYQNALQFKELI